MFPRSYFAERYFNEFFQIRGYVTGGGANKKAYVNWKDLEAMGLNQDDTEIMEIIAAFVMSR